MNVLLVLAVVAGGCVYALPPQHTHHHPNFLETSQNTTSYIKGKETQVLTYQEKSDVKGKEATVVHDDKLASQDKSHNTPDNHIRSHYVPRNTEARILDMNRRYPSRGKLKTLPDLTRLSKEGTPQTNNTKTKECSFACPQAESITPCTCDPCARAINCSVVASFQQLFTIFHTAAFPNPRFESFLLVSPLLKNFKGSSRSDTFLANTFGDVSFTSIWVESMTSLTVVETGAFKGSEGTLTNLVFRWNYGLTHFPFDEIAKMEVLQKLEVSGSSFTTLPAFPYNPHLSSLFLDDNRINTIPPQIFSKLSNLMYLDLAYNSLYMLSEDSLNFSSQNVIAFLDHNAITYIDERTFSGQQPILLDVSYNHLKGLDQGVFQPVLDNIIDNDDDSYVDATNNPLQCPSISWVLEDSLYLYFLALPEPPCTPAS
ncbi:oplophorus-luciferin 2-monooxygenase non-catalytic subunit-like [Portunus trituberculatus]|uniref:oplophorus-luciferin 2-monooxygenase non-catalytic subunit-like n=1 Tax=Portunus trituberculatus TaxID=210409 RepID=UPI001E1D084B|nr:oplophorus-luciferin 2-monooxygenase non-catalytic subunit-like [Portunus trituberculatus]XP_045136405.1 oplophorus-luciferin 2-monooxygenase non-catalytic subunit-like [Portunus trituberculatus]